MAAECRASTLEIVGLWECVVGSANDLQACSSAKEWLSTKQEDQEASTPSHCSSAECGASLTEDEETRTGEFLATVKDELDLALVAAGQLGFLSTVDLLVSIGADVDARSPPKERIAELTRTKFNWNADRAPVLALAASGAHVEVVEFLIDEGADVTTVDALGRDALELARSTFRGPEHILEPVIDLLTTNLNKPTSQETPEGKRQRFKLRKSQAFKRERCKTGSSDITATQILAFLVAAAQQPASSSASSTSSSSLSTPSSSSSSSSAASPIIDPEVLKLGEFILPLDTVPPLPNGTRKLHSYHLFRAMGSPRKCVAPMVDASELPFRLLCRKYGADAGWSPMIHSVSYASSKKYRAMFFQSCPEEGVVVAQFCANKPAVFVEAAKQLHRAHPNVCAVDLNLGCPQRIAQRGFFGSFLQDDMPLVYELVSTMARESPLPLTVKIRIMEDMNETLAYAQMIERAGAAMLTVHGRTRKEKDHRKGHANWHAIRQIRDVITIPLIANGSVGSYEDIEECLRISGADAVMSATGLLDNPAMFLPPDQQPSRWVIAREYLEFVDVYPPRGGYIARNHLFKLFHVELEANPDLYQRMIQSFSAQELQSVVDALEERLKLHPVQPSSQLAAPPAPQMATPDLDDFDDSGDEGIFGALFS